MIFVCPTVWLWFYCFMDVVILVFCFTNFYEGKVYSFYFFDEISVHKPSLFLTILYKVLALKTYLTINLQILFCPPLYTPLCLSVKRRQTQSSFYPFQFGHLLFQLFLLILYHWCFCLTATLIRYIIVTGTLPVCLSIFIKLLIGQGKIYNYLLAFLCL